MTRAAASEALRVLAAGLEPGDAGVRVFLERIAAHDDGQALRDGLVEIGAAAVLGAPWGAGGRVTRVERVIVDPRVGSL